MNTPYSCRRCAEEIIETEEGGNVLGFYGVLVSNAGVPMTGGNATGRDLRCPNCGTTLTPSKGSQ